MRALLSVKWKLILAVVGVSFVCLAGLTLLNRNQLKRDTQRRGRELVHDAATLEAYRYNLAAENVSTIVRGVNAEINAEFDYAFLRETKPDPSRLAAFLRSSLEHSPAHFADLGMVLFPGPDTASPLFDDYRLPDGSIAIKFSHADGKVVMFRRESLSGIPGAAWFVEVARNKRGIISEPYLDEHTTAGRRDEHVETRFAQPVLRNGRNIGVVWLELCLNDHLQLMRQRSPGEGDVKAVLVSPEGATIGRPAGVDLQDILTPSSTGLSRLRTDAHPDIAAAIREGREFNQTLSLGGRRFVVVATPIRREDISRIWSVLMFVPEEKALAGSGDGFAQQLYQMLAMLLASGLLGYLAARTMGKTLVTNEQWHRTILDRVPLPLGLLDLETRWTYANPALGAALGCRNRNELIGRGIGETSPSCDAGFILETNRPDAADIESLEVQIVSGRRHQILSCRLLDTEGEYAGRLIIGVDVSDARDIARTLGIAASIAKSLDSKSDCILGAAQSLSDAAMEKSAAIEEITSTTQKIGEASAINAESAKNSHTQAESTHAASDRGTTEALQAAGAMNGVRESGRKIRSIIKLIDDIAFQTNLLSLNAAVEAARAGRHGKGFAVVADEVRNLAQRSARAARETSAMIEEMTGRIDDATDSIEQLGSTLIEIKETAENLRENSDEVARLADQQSHSVNQVHLSLEQISKSVNSTITVSRETATVAESMYRQAAALRRLTHGPERDVAGAASAPTADAAGLPPAGRPRVGHAIPLSREEGS